MVFQEPQGDLYLEDGIRHRMLRPEVNTPPPAAISGNAAPVQDQNRRAHRRWLGLECARIGAVAPGAWALVLVDGKQDALDTAEGRDAGRRRQGDSAPVVSTLLRRCKPWLPGEADLWRATLFNNAAWARAG
jgi:hypothetical protein